MGRRGGRRGGCGSALHGKARRRGTARPAVQPWPACGWVRSGRLWVWSRCSWWLGALGWVGHGRARALGGVEAREGASERLDIVALLSQPDEEVAHVGVQVITRPVEHLVRNCEVVARRVRGRVAHGVGLVVPDGRPRKVGGKLVEGLDGRSVKRPWRAGRFGLRAVQEAAMARRRGHDVHDDRHDDGRGGARVQVADGLDLEGDCAADGALEAHGRARRAQRHAERAAPRPQQIGVVEGDLEGIRSNPKESEGIRRESEGAESSGRR